nr:MAG TPA: hypothetical protein [Caudoviricetes sp.]
MPSKLKVCQFEANTESAFVLSSAVEVILTFCAASLPSFLT